MEQADNSELSNKARNARRLNLTPTAFEAAQLIKQPASRGVSDFAKEQRCVERDGDNQRLRVLAGP